MATDLALKNWKIWYNGAREPTPILSGRSLTVCAGSERCHLFGHGFPDRDPGRGASDVQLKPVAVILRTISPDDCMGDSC